MINYVEHFKKVKNGSETFTKEQVEQAIFQFLEYAESEYEKSQMGYFSGSGWAARCLRWHLKKLEESTNA